MLQILEEFTDKFEVLVAVNVNFAVFLCNAVLSARKHPRSLLYLD